MLAGFRSVAAAPQDALHAGIIRGQRTHFCGVQYKHKKVLKVCSTYKKIYLKITDIIFPPNSFRAKLDNIYVTI